MKEFFKFMFASCLGTLLSTFIVVLLVVVFFAALVSSANDDEPVFVRDKSVLYLNLDQPITERTLDDSFNYLPYIGGGEPKNIGFNDIALALKKAAGDDKIKCVYINVSAPQAGMATMREVRQAILEFKKSKKPVIAYSEVYSQMAYYLASAASKVYLNPQGALELKGFNSEVMFFKGALDKLGIEAQIIRVGNYKSAVEPFTNTKMSDFNRKQVAAYVYGMYDVFLKGIAESRNLPADTLFRLADNYVIQQPEDALKYKLVDGLVYKDQLLDELKRLTGMAKKDNLNTVSLNDYAKNSNLDNKSTADKKVAVIYANGEIMGGEGDDNQIGSERISRAIRKARTDTTIKAIVLRVNSPGGSALASEVIWREVLLTKKVKPVIASFGDVAASGGYYIGCAADMIIVQPNTITGSIGVFGIIPNMQKLLNEKLGITFDGVKTGKYADIMDVSRPMTPGERFILQAGVNKVYNTFLTRVANGRGRSVKYIDSVGGGRVWTGTDAVRLGLADKTGSFRDAVDAAVAKAKLKDYKIIELPEKIDPLKALIAGARDNIKTYFAKSELGNTYPVYQKIKTATSISGVQTRMLYEPAIK